MNRSSPWLVPLQVLAGVLAVAIVALSIAWVRLQPTAAPIVSAVESAKAGAEPAAPASGAIAGPSATTEGAPPPSAPEPAADRAATSAVLYGQVLRATGEPIGQGVLWLYRDAEHVGTESMRTGTYSFAGLAPGHYRLRSRITDELPIEREVEVRAPLTRFDVELEPRWLLRVDAVTPAGEPLTKEFAAKVQGLSWGLLSAAAFDEAPTADLPLSNLRTVEAGVGTFREDDPFGRGGAKPLPPQAVGVLTLPPEDAVHVSLMLRNHIVATERVAPGQESVTFTMDVESFERHLSTVRVRVVDASGTPLAGVRVAVNDAQTGGLGQPTGDDGRIVIEHVKPGRLDLEIRHAELRAPQQQIDVPAGATVDLGDVELRAGVSVEFEMIHFEGRGSIRFNPLDPLPPGRTVDDGYMSRDNGSKWTLSLYPGRYGFLASAENGVALVEMDLREPPPTPVQFDLRPGAVLVVENRVGKGHLDYELTTHAGTIVRRRSLSGTSSERILVPPGAYVMTMTDRNGNVTRRDIAVPADGTSITVP